MLHCKHTLNRLVTCHCTSNHALLAACPPCQPVAPLALQVEDDDTALALAAELSRGKCGRVTFMPLNRLKPQEVQYPDQVGAAPGCSGTDY